MYNYYTENTINLLIIKFYKKPDNDSNVYVLYCMHTNHFLNCPTFSKSIIFFSNLPRTYLNIAK